jgi:hypothetical protein
MHNDDANSQLHIRLQSIDLRLERIELSIARLEHTMEAASHSCANMDDHISFVEGVYDAVRRPFAFVASKFYARPLPMPRPRAQEFLQSHKTYDVHDAHDARDAD